MFSLVSKSESGYVLVQWSVWVNVHNPSDREVREGGTCTSAPWGPRDTRKTREYLRRKYEMQFFEVAIKPSLSL